MTPRRRVSFRADRRHHATSGEWAVPSRPDSAATASAGRDSLQRRHDLAGEPAHRAHHPRARETADVEPADEVGKPQLLVAPKLGDATVRRPVDQAVPPFLVAGFFGGHPRVVAAGRDAGVVLAEMVRHPSLPAGLPDRLLRLVLAVGHEHEALDGDPWLPGVAGSGPPLDEALPERRDLLAAGRRAGEEGVVAPLGRPVDGLLALAGDPDGRVRRLDRARQHRDRARHGEEAALVREVVLGPRLQHQLQALLERRAAVLDAQVKPVELHLLVAAPDADVEAPLGQDVGQCNVLGETDRVPERRDEDRLAEADARRQRARLGDDEERIRGVPVVGRLVVCGYERLPYADAGSHTIGNWAVQ